MLRLIIFCCLFMSIGSDAQTSDTFPMPAGKEFNYTAPLNLPPRVSGTFGECRPEHFHAGLDLSTHGQTDIPVYALNDGYVFRIRVEPDGYGLSLFLKQTDERMVIYSHLSRLNPALQAYLNKKQFRTESWKQDMTLYPHQFPITKGSLLAYSGNSGNSEAPHLHIEVRNAQTDAPLNPALFIPEITDTLAPEIKQLSVYRGDVSFYHQIPQRYTVKHVGHSFQVQPKVIQVPSGKVCLGVQAHDIMPSYRGLLGIYEMKIWVDDKPWFGWRKDSLPHDWLKAVFAHADYTAYLKSKTWVELGFKLPGNLLPIYLPAGSDNGIITLRTGETRQIRIQLSDIYGNSSNLSFSLQGIKPVLYTKPKGQCLVPCQNNHVQNEYVELVMGDQCLLDTLYFNYQISPGSNPYTYRYTLQDPISAIHRFFEARFTPRQTIPEHLQGKLVIQKLSDQWSEKARARKAVIHNNRVQTYIRELGTYEIRVDTLAPIIQCGFRQGDTLRPGQLLEVKVNEETTHIRSWRAEVDGQWLMFEQQKQLFSYRVDERFPKGAHEIVMNVADENENERTIAVKVYCK